MLKLSFIIILNICLSYLILSIPYLYITHVLGFGHHPIYLVIMCYLLQLVLFGLSRSRYATCILPIYYNYQELLPQETTHIQSLIANIVAQNKLHHINDIPKLTIYSSDTATVPITVLDTKCIIIATQLVRMETPEELQALLCYALGIIYYGKSHKIGLSSLWLRLPLSGFNILYKWYYKACVGLIYMRGIMAVFGVLGFMLVVLLTPIWCIAKLYEFIEHNMLIYMSRKDVYVADAFVNMCGYTIIWQHYLSSTLNQIMPSETKRTKYNWILAPSITQRLKRLEHNTLSHMPRIPTMLQQNLLNAIILSGVIPIILLISYLARLI